MQDIEDADFPSYPLASQLCELVGVSYNEVELLDIPSHTWMGIHKGHVIALVNNLYVFVC